MSLIGTIENGCEVEQDMGEGLEFLQQTISVKRENGLQHLNKNNQVLSLRNILSVTYSLSSPITHTTSQLRAT